MKQVRTREMRIATGYCIQCGVKHIVPSWMYCSNYCGNKYRNAKIKIKKGG